MTLPQVFDIFTYWNKCPPSHLLLRDFVGYKPKLTVEEQWAAGAMGPEDFSRWVQLTGGSSATPMG